MCDYFQAVQQLAMPVMVNSDGRSVPLRYIGEQHVIEDLGFIPTMREWAEPIAPEEPKPMKRWMALGAHKIHREIEAGKFDPRPIPSEETSVPGQDCDTRINSEGSLPA